MLEGERSSRVVRYTCIDGTRESLIDRKANPKKYLCTGILILLKCKAHIPVTNLGLVPDSIPTRPSVSDGTGMHPHPREECVLIRAACSPSHPFVGAVCTSRLSKHCLNSDRSVSMEDANATIPHCSHARQQGAACATPGWRRGSAHEYAADSWPCGHGRTHSDDRFSCTLQPGLF